MEQTDAINNGLQIRISLAAAPAVSFNKNNEPATNDGFRINVEAVLQYESLNRALNGLLAGRRFDISEGLVATYVIVQTTSVSADAAGNLLIKMQFSGSFGGTVYFKGGPVYDAATQTIRIAGMAYKLESSSFLLQTAKWLFNNKIAGELKKHAQFTLAHHLETAKAAIDSWLNKEWTKGISGEGKVGDLTLTEVAALPEHLSIRSQCNGRLIINIGELNLGM